MAVLMDGNQHRSLAGALAIAVTALVLLLVATGCGSDSSAAPNSANAAQTEKAVGMRAVLAGVGDASLKGMAWLPNFPAKDGIAITANGVGPASGEHEYALWGISGPTVILLGTWPAGKDGNLKVRDDVSVPKVLNLLHYGPTRLLITRADTDRLWAAMEKLRSYSRPSYMGDEVLEGTLSGPGAAAATEE